MLFLSLLRLGCLAVTVAASSILPRNDLATADVAGVLVVLERINTGLTRVGAEVKLWQGESRGASNLLYYGRQIINDLATGAQYIDSGSTLGLLDPLQLLVPFNTMNNLVGTYTTNIIEKKAQVDALGLSPLFAQVLHSAKLGALDLSRAITNKLPITGSWAAGPVTNEIVQKLEKAVAAFGGVQNFAPVAPPPQQPNQYQPDPYQQAAQTPNPYYQPQPQGNRQPAPTTFATRRPNSNNGQRPRPTQYSPTPTGWYDSQPTPAVSSSSQAWWDWSRPSSTAELESSSSQAWWDWSQKSPATSTSPVWYNGQATPSPNPYLDPAADLSSQQVEPVPQF